MVQCCEALTLRTYPFAEAHKVVVFLTREFGQLRGVAYGAKNSRSRFGTALEPLTIVRVTFRRGEHQELADIQNCEIICPSPAYASDWERQLYLGYIAEILVEFSREQVAGERLFRLSRAVIDATARASLPLLARYFELWVLQLEGILPALDRILPAELAERTRVLMRRRPQDVAERDWAAADLEELEKAAGKLMERHLEKPLKAKRLLKELL
jgi:DNA repair protein RecO (recombination protein O)